MWSKTSVNDELSRSFPKSVCGICVDVSSAMRAWAMTRHRAGYSSFPGARTQQALQLLQKLLLKTSQLITWLSLSPSIVTFGGVNPDQEPTTAIYFLRGVLCQSRERMSDQLESTRTGKKERTKGRVRQPTKT